MAGERMYPILPCADLDEAVGFYEALGFRVSYRQLRPNPHAVVELGDMAVHLAGIPGFDAAADVCSVVVVVPDPGQLHADFAEGLRGRFGRVPVAGLPRLLRVRRKQGTATGFSVVDPDGSWLRFYAAGAGEPDEGDGPSRSEGLARALEVAARHGDARGEDQVALDVLDRGLARHHDAAATDRVRALLYRCELLVRLGRTDEARTTLHQASATTPDAHDAQDAQAAQDLADELQHVEAMLR